MVQTTRSEINSEGAPQLVLTDFVHQLEPPVDGQVKPDLDNTVKTLFYWAMDLDIPHGPRLVFFFNQFF